MSISGQLVGAASDKNKKIGILDRLEDLLKSITGSNKETGEGVLSVVPNELRDLKESMGSTFTESEGKKILGLPRDTVPNLTTAQQEDMRYLKEQGGGQFTEKEAMRTIGEGIQATDVDEQFGRVLSAMPVWQQESVINFITSQGMTPAQITKFKQEVLLGNISPYELENLQTNQSTQSNLGLSNDQYAQGSQFYNYDLGVFLPSEWQTGFTGRTVDGNNYFREELQSNPHSKSRNYYEEKMKLPRYIPLKLG